MSTISPELAKAAAAAFHAVADYLQTGHPMPGYLIALLTEVAAACGGIGGLLVMRRAVKKSKQEEQL